MLSILIVHYNRPDLLRACLGSMHESENVVVVDNGSLTPKEAAALRTDFPWANLILLPENLGFSAALNHAARHAEGDVFFILNPDTQMDGVVGTHIENAYAASPAAVLGLRQVNERGDLQLSIGWGPRVPDEMFRKLLQGGINDGRQWARSLLQRLQGGTREVSWVAGSALVVSREVFERVSGFDSGFFLYFEDIDFCLRVREQGETVQFCSDLTITHIGGACAATDATRAKAHYRRSQARFFRVHGQGMARWFFPLWSRVR